MCASWWTWPGRFCRIKISSFECLLKNVPFIKKHLGRAQSVHVSSIQSTPPDSEGDLLPTDVASLWSRQIFLWPPVSAPVSKQPPPLLQSTQGAMSHSWNYYCIKTFNITLPLTPTLIAQLVCLNSLSSLPQETREEVISTQASRSCGPGNPSAMIEIVNIISIIILQLPFHFLLPLVLNEGKSNTVLDLCQLFHYFKFVISLFRPWEEARTHAHRTEWSAL